jgi:hypothetical protein
MCFDGKSHLDGVEKEKENESRTGEPREENVVSRFNSKKHFSLIFVLSSPKILAAVLL